MKSLNKLKAKLTKILGMFLVGIFSPVLLLGQAETAPAPSLLDDPLLSFYIVVGFIFIVAILVLIVALYMLQVLNYMAKTAAKEKAEKLGLVYKEAPSLWESLWQKANDLSPIEKEADIMLDHNYDGIRELDNHLPPWWTALFYGTIVFAFFYLLFFHVLDTLPGTIQEYDNEVAIAAEQLKKNQAANPVADINENNVEATLEPLALADGKQVFMNNCASCHRKDGGGDIGPNLTDEYWLHGGGIKDIFKVVRHGVSGTNMIAWEGFISPEKMKNVSSYILTIKGTNPVNPKKPQGELFKLEQKQVKPDSTSAQASL